MARRIEDYALIGDCETAALVGRDGSIDWLCWPRFDSEACFAALLGTPEHGRWLIAPAGPVRRVERRYRDNTLILETDFETPEGAVTLIDFMPIRDAAIRHRPHRRRPSGRGSDAHGVVLRFDYGRIVPWVSPRRTRTAGGHRRPALGESCRTDARTRGDVFTNGRRFTVREGERIPFVLTYRASHLSASRAGGRRSGRCAERRIRGSELGETMRLRRAPGPRPSGARSSRIKAMTYRARPAASWPPRPPRCRSSTAAVGTGITASAGCATPPS